MIYPRQYNYLQLTSQAYINHTIIVTIFNLPAFLNKLMHKYLKDLN